MGFIGSMTFICCEGMNVDVELIVLIDSLPCACWNMDLLWLRISLVEGAETSPQMQLYSDFHLGIDLIADTCFVVIGPFLQSPQYQ